MSVAQRALRGTVIILASSYANMALGMAYNIILARLLAPEYFGVFAGAMFLATLLDLRGKLGLDYAFIHRQPTTEALLATHWLLQMGTALITLVVGGVVALFVAQLNYPAITGPLVVAISSTLLLEAAGSTARVALEKELSFGRSTMVVTGGLFFSYVGALGIAWLGGTYWALLAQVGINTLICTVGFWWVYQSLEARLPLRFYWDKDLARWMLRYGATITLGTLATVFLLQFDNFLVLTFAGSAAAGYYVQAYKIAQWPTGLVTHIVTRASLPTYAKLQNDLPRLGKAFEMSLWLILTVAIPLALAIFVTAPDFLQLLYGVTWLPAALPLQFLIGYSVLRPLLDDAGALFAAIGQPKRLTQVLGLQACVLVLCATPLTIFYGSLGTAIGVGLAFLVGIALAYYFMAQTLQLKLTTLFIAPALAIVLSLLFTGWVSEWLLLANLPLLFRVIARGGLAVGTFIVIIFALQRRVFIERIQYIVKLLKPTSK